MVDSNFAATRFVDYMTPRKRSSNVIVLVKTSMLPSILPSLDEICKNRPLFGQLEFTKKLVLLSRLNLYFLALKKDNAALVFVSSCCVFFFSGVVSSITVSTSSSETSQRRFVDEVAIVLFKYRFPTHPLSHSTDRVNALANPITEFLIVCKLVSSKFVL